MNQKLFRLNDDDEIVIRIAKDFARNYLKTRADEPREIIGLGNVLFALERLPKATEGVYCEFGVSIRGGSDGFGEMKYFYFNISPESFGVSRGGSVYDPGVGSDSYSLSGWHVGTGEYRESSAEPYELENYLDSLIRFGAEFHVMDESQIDYDSPDPEDEEDDEEDEEITAEEALDIARQELPKFVPGPKTGDEAIDARQARIKVYGNFNIDNCWCIYVYIPGRPTGLFSSDVILICKESGQVVYCGSAHDEG